MKDQKKILLGVFVILAAICGTYLAVNAHYQKNPNTVEVVVEKQLPPQIVEVEVEIDGETIEWGIKEIGELATAEYYYSHLESTSASKAVDFFGHNITLPFTQNSFIYSYDGIIKAGIKLDEVHVNKDDENKVITVIANNAVILSSEVDEDSFQLFDEKNNVFNPISVSEMAASFADLKHSEEAKAIDKGLLAQANKNAESILMNFIKNSYRCSDYQIRIIWQ